MKKNRTVEDYKRAGASMRLLKAVLTEAYMACSEVMSAKDCDKFEVAIRRVDTICSKAEDNMFRDFPELSDQYLGVFYGTPDTCTTEVDKEQIGIMLELVKGLFKNN